MINAFILIVIGLALFFSGIWEQNLFTIILGLLLEAGGWILFVLKWRSAKQKGNLDNNEK
ncbi:hypothetical protein [Pseudidiomarina salilacus]|uniref:hypothetical protein n=1 Tax=Pseudidiomarina salilacus TaxID=3384452 RepID=UPI003985273B